ncbi:putative undecaprenyl-phosphate N-acetylglucosaminyl 1-phosphate transferase [subsurface metagenome]
MIYYFIIFCISLFVAFLFTILAKNIAPSIGAIDKPSDIKIHKKTIPRLGGLAIYVAFLISMIFIYYFKNNLYFISKNKMVGVFVGGTIVFLTGLIDDTITVKASYKLLFQAIAASVLFFYGIRMNLFPNLWISYIFTIIYVVGSYSIMDMIDGLDGLAAGIATICSTFFLIVFCPQGNDFGIFISLMLIGSSLGFLKHNFFPANIFMGDSGSMLLGFLLATLMIIFTNQPYNLIRFIIPILILGVPILDNFLTFLYRFREGKSFLAGDLNHFYNRVMSCGVSHKNTVLVMYLVSVIFGLNAVLFTVNVNVGWVFLIILGIGIFYSIRKVRLLERKS